jgi:hypothetical protein
MSTAPFRNGPETLYDPQSESMCQTTLPQITQKELAQRVGRTLGEESERPTSYMEKHAEKDRDERVEREFHGDGVAKMEKNTGETRNVDRLQDVGTNVGGR